MTKRDFIMQYALNRALGNKGGLDGAIAIREGLRAWEELERVAPKVEVLPPPPLAPPERLM